jgi:hypothetical protein
MDFPENGLKWGLGAALAGLVIVAAGSAGYVSHERAQMRTLAATNHSLNDSLAQMQTQLQEVQKQVAERPAPAAPPVASPVSTARPRVQPRSTQPRPAKAAARTADPRIGQLQSKLEAQQKELSNTREDLDNARKDLEGKLDSTRAELNGSVANTRAELNGSIARTHDEVVALQKRGERNYYEFNLTKSKSFQKVGPLQLSLRKVNTKRKSFDFNMMVEDNQLQKKNVNLYETVWINVQDRPQALELVVNQISKDQVQGYIVEPKYKRSELEASAAAPRPAETKTLETRP